MLHFPFWNDFIFPRTHFNFNIFPRLLKPGCGLAEVLTPVKVLSSCCWSTFFFISLSLFLFTSCKWKWNFQSQQKSLEKKKVFTKQCVYRTALNTHTGQNSAWGFQKKLYLALYDLRIHSPQVQNLPIKCWRKSQINSLRFANKHEVNHSGCVSVGSGLDWVQLSPRNESSRGLFCFSDLRLARALSVGLIPTVQMETVFIYLLGSEVERRKGDMRPSRNSAERFREAATRSRSRWWVPPRSSSFVGSRWFVKTPGDRRKAWMFFVREKRCKTSTFQK